MQLTSPRLKRRAPRLDPHRSPTAEPGHINPNRQQVLASTGAPSQLRPTQTIYRLRCGDCHHEYGCSGLDIKDRRCPHCQDGAPGESLRESPQRTLFDPPAEDIPNSVKPPIL